MGKVDEDEADKNKDGCSKGCDPVAPNDEEAVTPRVEAPFRALNNAGKVTEKWISTKNALRMM